MIAKYRKEELKQKKQELDQEKHIQNFINYNKEQKAAKKLKKRKLSFEDMPDYSTSIHDFDSSFEIRDKSEFKPKSHNKEKQNREYVQFLYFPYKAPLFLIDSIINNHPDIKRRSAVTVVSKYIFPNITLAKFTKAYSSGESMRKLLSDSFTKKEIHYLLNSTKETAKEASLEAKIKYLEINKSFSKYLLTLTRLINSPFSERTKVILNFVKKHQEGLTIPVLQELLDFFELFVFDELDNNERKKLFNRSLNNIIIESNEWHTIQIFIKNKAKTEWTARFEDWSYRESEEVFYEMKEITTAKILSQEGRNMGHCVSGYANRCSTGKSSIISLTKNGEREVTVEIDYKMNNISQAKRRKNFSITESDNYILKKYADDNDLTISNIRYL